MGDHAGWNAAGQGRRSGQSAGQGPLDRAPTAGRAADAGHAANAGYAGSEARLAGSWGRRRTRPPPVSAALRQARPGIACADLASYPRDLGAPATGRRCPDAGYARREAGLAWSRRRCRAGSSAVPAAFRSAGPRLARCSGGLAAIAAGCRFPGPGERWWQSSDALAPDSTGRRSAADGRVAACASTFAGTHSFTGTRRGAWRRSLRAARPYPAAQLHTTPRTGVGTTPAAAISTLATRGGASHASAAGRAARRHGPGTTQRRIAARRWRQQARRQGQGKIALPGMAMVALLAATERK
jgi:hypothetical protein